MRHSNSRLEAIFNRGSERNECFISFCHFLFSQFLFLLFGFTIIEFFISTVLVRCYSGIYNSCPMLRVFVDKFHLDCSYVLLNAAPIHGHPNWDLLAKVNYIAFTAIMPTKSRIHRFFSLSVCFSFVCFLLQFHSSVISTKTCEFTKP